MKYFNVIIINDSSLKTWMTTYFTRVGFHYHSLPNLLRLSSNCSNAIFICSKNRIKLF